VSGEQAEFGGDVFGGWYQGRKVLVTGHTGFKGSWLCDWLLNLGAQVTGYALAPVTAPALFEQLGLGERIEHQLGDIRDSSGFEEAVVRAQPDFVFHLAAQPLVRASYREPVETYATNVMGAVQLLEALRAIERPCAVVIVTSDKCYENREWLYGYRENDPLGGHDPYSSSKAAAELAVSAWRQSFFGEHPVRIATARAGNVIGGGDWAEDRIVPDCIRALQEGASIAVRNPHATRPWQHVLEPLSGYLWLAARLYEQGAGNATTGLRDHGTTGPQDYQTKGPRDQETKGPGNSVSDRLRTARSELPPPRSAIESAFNFGPGQDANRTVRELVEEVLKHWPGRWEDHSEPDAPHEANLLQLCTDKADALLGWRPVWSFAEAVRATVEWYRELSTETEGRAFREKLLGQIQEYTGRANALGLPWAGS